ncbi:LysM peptidoglycan-binding domain-containing protein [uncultured Tenacibaculum sp.]|uniref:PBP1 and LysM peptidoglycan-binding domain-containing protein n=1 Tax=uncultured Tenacibaculum sp. TaxID=174713 RepID=UPI00261B3C82|nr:LysM peptidoglycan-binding domain-containing protein [uncultured Tenacibaculum sp.]
MNKIKFWAFTLVLAMLVSCSQQKRYISYKVKEGESMREIAERINVKTEDLVRLNPDVGENPSTNSVIIVPNPKYKKQIPLIQEPKEDKDTDVVKDETITDTSSDNDNTTKDEENTDIAAKADSTQIVRTVIEFKKHTVQPGETVYRITKQYDISKEELINLNPQYPRLRDNYLDVGQVLKVKVAEKKIVYLSREEDLKNHVTHTVKSKETVYSLTRFYNITKEDLMNLNPEYPEIEDNQLQIGQVLRIRNIADNVETYSSEMFIDSIADIEENIKVALLLPFRADEYNGKDYEDIFDTSKADRGNANLANLVTDFYMGSEIAIDSIKSLGIKVDVSVFDTGNRGKNIEQILEKELLNEMNAIIGPFYSDKVSSVAKSADAPVIFPHFSRNQSQFSSSKIVKSAPDKITRSEVLANYLSKIHDGESIFIVSDGTEVSDAQAKEMTKILRDNDSIKDVFVLKPEKGYIKKERFTDKMKPNSSSWVIIATDQTALVANAVNSMVVLPEGLSAKVFAISKGSSYENVDNNTLARIGFTYVTDNYANYDDENLKDFINKYKAKNNDIPSQYAVRGFDITFDVLMRLASGEKLLDTYKKGSSIRLENKFEFDKKLFGSVYNKGLFIVKYNPDLTLQRIK